MVRIEKRTECTSDQNGSPERTCDSSTHCVLGPGPDASEQAFVTWEGEGLHSMLQMTEVC